MISLKMINLNIFKVLKTEVNKSALKDPMRNKEQKFGHKKYLYKVKFWGMIFVI